MVDLLKICSKCDIEKPLEQFYNHTIGKDGKHSECIDCMKIYRKKYYLQTFDDFSKRQKINRIKNPNIFKNTQLKTRYGITLDQYNEMLKNQNGFCAICNKKETKIDIRTNKIRALCVDHEHISGKIRGLLCQDCNFAIGKLKDNISLVENTLNYLKKNVS